MTDIVERLRRKVFHGPTMEAAHTRTVEWQAADEIERLRADLHEADEEFSLLQNDLGQALTEIDRLRAALQKINVGEGWAALIARAALEGK